MRSAIIALLIGAQALHAQSAALLGTVMRDTLGHALAGGIEVRIPQLKGATQTNYMGEFRLSPIPPGTYLVTIRTVGYEPFSDSITFAAGQTINREFVLKPIATQLEAVQTQASAVKKYRSPALNAFEERRTSGHGGYFITDSVFRAAENGRLPDVLGRIPGLQKVPDRAATYMASSRSASDGGPVFMSKKSQGVTYCFVTVYVDGIMRWQGPPSASNPPLDMNTAINIVDLAGAEFYAGGAAIPVQFNATSTSCGVLLLWTREQ
jgi:hypothetical protein